MVERTQVAEQRVFPIDLTASAAVVTGAGSGIGAALAWALARAGARGLVLCDINGAETTKLAERITGAGARALAVVADVAIESDVRSAVRTAVEEFGSVDLVCSNAGIAPAARREPVDDDWESCWSVHVMAHVYAARAALPSMIRRGRGYLLNTCSAGGLLTLPGDAPYTVTKHAAVAFAEWLAFTYARAGIRVSALCPQAVATPLLERNADTPSGQFARVSGRILSADQVAQAAITGIAAERFLILPHPEVASHERAKVADRDAWILDMRRWSSHG
jgi:NAD(P)-dependent dehydrogenase (short-subunit alcohol dehydrogenase family)